MIKNLKVSAKLLLAVAVGVIALLVVGTLGISNLGNMNDQLDEMYRGAVLGIKTATNAEQAIRRIEVAEAEYLNLNNEVDRGVLRKQVQQDNTAFNMALEESMTTLMHDAEREIVQRVNESYNEYQQVSDQYFIMTDQDQARRFREEQVAARRSATNAGIEELVQLKTKLADETQIQEVSRATEQMVAGSEDIVQAITNINDVAQQVAAAAEEMAAGTEEQSASLEEIAASADKLAQLGQELQGVAARFKL